MKLKINVNSKATPLEFTGQTMVAWDAFHLGLGYTTERKLIRMVRWRFRGMCRYIYLGERRGKIVDVARGFKAIRQLTEKEKVNVKVSVDLYKQLGL